LGLGSFVTNGSSLVTSGNTVTFTSGFSDGDSGQTWIDNGLSGGTSFNGGFTNGEYLVSTTDNQAPSTPDTLTLTLTNAVSEFGLYVEEFDYQNNFTATISTDGGSVSYTSPTSTGDPVFVGLVSTSANITSITLSTGGPEAGYFLIGEAYFQDGNGTQTPPNNPPSGTPEPASMMMVGGGIAALAWKARRRVRG
jgi:hypothetical protein